MISINNLDELNHFANVLVRHLEPSDLILLNGDLGAGKTTLTQFIGKHLGVKRNINSPTFNIIKSYKGSNLKLHHMDCYRLEDSDEDLGFDEYFQDEGITIIEWSQFIQDLLPKEHLIINIETLSETKRTIKLEAQGTHYLKVKEEVESEFIND
ncbi:tRNA (adenosine(37)-N6)-threonylcarbamoyltransferase complex ATPase subunit type 1 TsaE [Staphylococcus sp. EG-SA-6]|jgi:tRNA threonylcarbamoyladenosine biosynthesis protein TsaE|uniref:tRNA threonylcarbamoyladenosine biosynthesis protein TsaE n=4 Tax=Staphylococcus haemolyticus TaxID=1283 RepID=A0A2A1K954_STAHA|nr:MULTISPECIES: tRNA (adenosine(37)-N6)-threonylcarbamoyltransferase complex ATPase subunit type 1 TsaE [Staphylococcus]KDP56022.1 tRNA threonylcarbamoyl adenosine modification protein YjeE [Staphylococcus aureus subsp. aureus CO-98]MBN4934022.1 tRNA (adenosine(37)-N6)-threonylcarbamoyltransferase complex ATPase subunit type 1 TsaE [Staphylococcus sp. EG-SA-6]MDU2098980.1 tRNA (adenosine(37)-N6)-threonylcarbamoyltransferase complex ATPase subunit type 1 TsaE [Staphylococcus sp.]AKC75736.1 ATPa